MPGKDCLYEDNINTSITNLPNLFGFYYCHIKTNDLYLGLLSFRSKKGIIMPNGS